MTNPNVVYKVSGTGYLCARDANQTYWHVICRLTPEQITAWNEVARLIDLTRTPEQVPEQINVTDRTPVGSIVLSTISHFVNDPNFKEKFGGTSPTVEVRMTVNGHNVPVVETLADIYRRMDDLVEQSARKKALEMVTAASLEPLADALREAETKVREQLKIFDHYD